MGFFRRWWWLLIVLIALIAWLAWPRGTTVPAPVADSGSGTGATAKPSTDLEIELNGGFGYVPTRPENRLELGFLKSVDVPGCSVPQGDIDLIVIEGTFLEPSPAPPARRFRVNDVVVTFPALEAANLPLTLPRGPRPTQKPSDPLDPAAWQDLSWVPGISADFPASSLNPNWRAMVTGRMALKGGRVNGLDPSNVEAAKGEFDFKTAGAATGKFKHAVTDRAQYNVRVPADRVEILLNSGSGSTRVVLVPQYPGRGVKLKLYGVHGGGQMEHGAPVKDFCAFYQLLQPVPPEAQWLVPHFLSATPPAPGDQGGKPSPGFFCPGDWF